MLCCRLIQATGGVTAQIYDKTGVTGKIEIEIRDDFEGIKTLDAA